MQTRHRIPTIFNLSMVDVLCCALGCVILLWLVYFKEARERSVAAGKTGKELVVAKQKLETLTRDLASAQQALGVSKTKHDSLTGQLIAVANQRDELAAKWERVDRDHQNALLELKEANTKSVSLRIDLSKLETANAVLGTELAKKTKDNATLTGQVTAAGKTQSELSESLANRKAELALAASHAVELKTQLADSEKKASKLTQQLAMLQTLSKEYSDQVGKLESKAMILERDLDKQRMGVAEANKRQDDLSTLKVLLEQSLAAAKSDLEKSRRELAEAKLANGNLSGESTALTQQVSRLQAAAENRFAGIELTGRNVMFLIDMSGSMGMKNYTERDPEKWPLLCEILAKLMRSLPDLRQFQVILFSDRFIYPLGSKGKWIENSGPDSIKKAVDAVRAVKPEGSTTMSTPIEEAFTYRAIGLDTVYLFSDGLPNSGDGLPPNAERLTESELGNILGKYIRNRLKTTLNVPYGRWTKSRVRINAVGFYFDSPDVGAFLWTLARENGGSFVGLSKP
jgi:hypothetical protein